MTDQKPVCLAIAGSDSSGGAGIQADIKAMQANGVYAATVITSVTAQNTVAVEAAFDLPVDIIARQMAAVCSDLTVAASKTGMLSSAAIIEVVADGIRRFDLHPLVVDPVMISKSGFPLLANEAVQVMIEQLLPLAELLTPNAHEAGKLAGIGVRTMSDAREAARRIHDMGCKYVLVKGGHIDEGGDAVDLLYDGQAFEVFRSERFVTRNTHGTGCTYSSAIAANLAKGHPMVEAVARAKEYVTEAIRHGLNIGSGHGPTDHFFFLGN